MNPHEEMREYLDRPYYRVVLYPDRAYLAPQHEGERLVELVRMVHRYQWVSFTDLSGSVVHVRPADISSIETASAETRARDRAQTRILKDEQKAEGEW